MIRQAHTYLVGAVSGTALVAAAVVAFVLLVSFQALRDWPLADLSLGGGDDAASSPNRAGEGPAGTIQKAPAGSPGSGTAAGSRAGAAADRPSNGTPSTEAAVGASPVPSASSPGAAAPSPTPAAQSAPGTADRSGSSSSTAGGGGNGDGGGTLPGIGGSGGGLSSPSEAVTGTVDKAVSEVDEATGGALGSSGVTEAGEEAVNDVAGPESVVGQTVDETVKTVGGLLGGDR